MVTIRHSVVVTGANDPTKQVSKDAWNDEHEITGLTKADVGLGNVDNTPDASKPISSAQQAALDAKLNAGLAGVFGLSWLGTATAAAAKALLNLVKADVGLDNVDNTSDANKPLSTAQAAATALGGLTAYQPGRWYQPVPAATVTGVTISQNRLIASPFIVRQRATISALGIRIQAAVSGGKVQVAFYASGSDGLPTGAPVATVSDLSTSAVGLVTGTVSQGTVQLQPGLHWMAVNCDVAGVVSMGPSANLAWTPALIGSATANNVYSNGSPGFVLFRVQNYGAWHTAGAGSFVEVNQSAASAIIFKVDTTP
jgi:hypothetical protein